MSRMRQRKHVKLPACFTFSCINCVTAHGTQRVVVVFGVPNDTCQDTGIQNIIDFRADSLAGHRAVASTCNAQRLPGNHRSGCRAACHQIDHATNSMRPCCSFGTQEMQTLAERDLPCASVLAQLCQRHADRLRLISQTIRFLDTADGQQVGQKLVMRMLF
jgi:hypothetical protein